MLKSISNMPNVLNDKTWKVMISIILFMSFIKMNLNGQRVLPSSANDSLNISLLKEQIFITEINHQLVTNKVTQQIVKPFFCNMEHKMNSKSLVPIFFRLGSKDYVDALEGK